MTTEHKGIEVYKSIAAVTGALAQEGISKDRKNQQQGFQYRGIDDVYNALAHLLAEHKLCVLPRMVDISETERTSAKGCTLFYSKVTAEYDFVSAVDGSKHTIGPVYGEAFDSGDKCIGKAMSYAYKAMAFMTFAIPTEGDNDPDATTHEIKPKSEQQGGQERSLDRSASPDALTAPQLKMITGKCKVKKVEESALAAAFKVTDIASLKKSQVNDALAWIDGAAQS